MKTFLFTYIFCLFISSSMGQVSKSKFEEEKTKRTIIDFLNWYKQGQTKFIQSHTLEPNNTIIVWDKIDTLVKPSVNMVAVEDYLTWLKASGFISETFINNLRQYHQKIADELIKVNPTPKDDGLYSIPGLDMDVVFGSFEPNEVLERYKNGFFKRISIVYNKAIVQFYVPPSKNYDATKMIFTLTKGNKIWLIDYIGYYN